MTDSVPEPRAGIGLRRWAGRWVLVATAMLPAAGNAGAQTPDQPTAHLPTVLLIPADAIQLPGEVDSNSPAVWGSDEEAGQVPRVDPLQQRVVADARPDRARSGRHRFFDGRVALGGQHLAAEAAEDDALLVDDDAGVPPCCADAFAHVGEPLGKGAGRHLAVRAGTFVPSRGRP